MTSLTPSRFGLLASVLLAVAGPAGAATYVVNTTDIDLPDTNTALAGCDANPVVMGDQCTLRAAIMQANASAGADTIVLPLDTTITLTLAGIGNAESGDLDISAPVTITGAALGFPADFAALPRIEATFAERLFDVGQDVAVTFRGMVLADGAPTGGAGTNGGALRITAAGAEVLVDRVRFRDNIAATGAAISNSGQLVVTGSDFLANVATAGAAAIQTNASGQTTLRGSSIREIRNLGATREALRVAAGGTLVVENSDIDGASQLGAPPPTPTTGIRAERPTLLAIRNSTLVDFTDHALDLVTDGATTVRVYNSILAGSDGEDCAATAIAGPAADVVFDYNLVQTGSCNGAVGGGNWIGQPATLGMIESGTDRFFVARRPMLGSRALDGGAPADAGGVDPLRLCLAADTYGTPRPLDGDANGVPRCDMGAVESSALTSSTYAVAVYDADLPDINPGDNRCDADAVAIGSQCTLRAAVMEANAKPGPDRIVFTGGGDRTITLTRAGGGAASDGDLDITEQLTIEGAADPDAPETVAIQNDVNGERALDVVLPAGQSFRLRDVRIQFSDAIEGGGVRVAATLAEFERVAFFSNVVSGDGGAIAASGGLLAVRDSDLSFNQAGNQGAAIHSTASATLIERSSLRDNTAAGQRAALSVSGATSLDIRNSTFHRNTSGIRADTTLVIDIRASTIGHHETEGLLVDSGVGVSTVSVRGSVFDANAVHCQFVGGFGANVMAFNHVDAANAACAPLGSGATVGPALLAPEARRDPDRVSWYRVPLHGSPLIDAIPGDAGPQLCAGQDQRGLARPVDSDGNGDARCEIGAVELTAPEAAPREFIVDTRFDGADGNAGDGLCRRIANESCSLRAAIMEANALPGPDRIILPANDEPYVLTIPQAAGADDATGDLRISDGLTLRGVIDDAGARPTIAASHADRLFSIFNVNTPVVLEGLRLSGGEHPIAGGAMLVANSSAVSLRQLDIQGNSATNGGAIHAENATLLIEDSDFSGNHGDGPGAAIRSEASFLEIRRSSIRASTDSGVGAEQEAVYASGDGSTLVRNSTFSGNAGTALRILDGDLELNNVTLAGNSRRGIEFARLTGRNLLIRNTVLTGNGLGACSLTGAGDAGIATDAYNLTQGTGCDLHAGLSNIVQPEAFLAPLVVAPDAFTAYHLPLPGSPLRDAGHPDVSAIGCSADDQLGLARPIDGDGNGLARCDIGAIEAAPVVDAMFADSFE